MFHVSSIVKLPGAVILKTASAVGFGSGPAAPRVASAPEPLVFTQSVAHVAETFVTPDGGAQTTVPACFACCVCARQ